MPPHKKYMEKFELKRLWSIEQNGGPYFSRKLMAEKYRVHRATIQRWITEFKKEKRNQK